MIFFSILGSTCVLLSRISNIGGGSLAGWVESQWIWTRHSLSLSLSRSFLASSSASPPRGSAGGSREPKLLAQGYEHSLFLCFQATRQGCCPGRSKCNWCYDLAWNSNVIMLSFKKQKRIQINKFVWIFFDMEEGFAYGSHWALMEDFVIGFSPQGTTHWGLNLYVMFSTLQLEGLSSKCLSNSDNGGPPLHPPYSVGTPPLQS